MKPRRLAAWIPLAGFALLASCNSKKQQTETVAEAVKVEAMTAVAQDVDQPGVFTATVEAENVNNIAPQSAGRIKRVFVEVGDHVASGQKLAEMDASNLEQAKLQMENHKLEFDRVDELYKVGGISKSTWDNRKLAYELSAATYENLKENTYLRSPITGIVTQRNYDSGDMFTLGDPLFVVEQIRPVKLVVNVSESLFTKVKRDMEVEVTLNVYGDEKFLGVVKLIYPSIDPHTRTFPVEIRLNNTDERIRPGMFARAAFNFGTEHRVMISDRAIQKQTGAADRYVFVVQNGTAVFRKVELGRRIGDEYEVIDGIAEGEQVITTGQNRLNDGAKVEILAK